MRFGVVATLYTSQDMLQPLGSKEHPEMSETCLLPLGSPDTSSDSDCHAENQSSGQAGMGLDLEVQSMREPEEGTGRAW